MRSGLPSRPVGPEGVDLAAPASAHPAVSEKEDATVE
jgi:hypothetical protein